MTSPSEKFREWMPIRFYRQGSIPFVDWCHMGDARFTEPFFADTVYKRMREPFNLLFRHQTPIELVAEILEGSDVIPPTGFIFHMSRCGSTLVAQMLASLATNIVISEAPPIDAAISETDGTVNDQERAHWLRTVIMALGRKRNVGERNYFIKFDSWNTLDLGFIKSVFPEVPWIFLYRDPLEVIVSQMRQRGSQMIPGRMKRLFPGLSLDEVIKIPPEEYCATILMNYCEAALAHAKDAQALLVNYDELPSAVTGSIAKHFRVSFSPEEIAQMNSAAQFDAKSPRLTFEPDTERKRAEASDAAREAATLVRPVYEELEKIRTRISV